MDDKQIVVTRSMRLNILRLAYKVGEAGQGVHIAPSLSLVEILAVLFTAVMRPQDDFVLSKGHGALAYYAALKEAGVITDTQLNTFDTDGCDFPGQPTKHTAYGVIFSSGSLGMGLSYACGLAIAAKSTGSDKKIYVLLGDGELNEGTNWEAVMLAKQRDLGNLVAIVDCNGMQSDGDTASIVDVDLESVFRAFGWQTYTCDGHDMVALTAAIGSANDRPDGPKVILAKTIKGKGVSFMENSIAWHHNRLNGAQYQDAVREVDCVGL